MAEIVVVGLGPGSLDQISYGVWRILTQEKHIYLRTAEHPIVAQLKEQGVVFRSFDEFYEKRGTFAEVYQSIVEKILELARKLPKEERLVYAVPGHPTVAEESVQILLKRAAELPLKVCLLPSMSFMDSIYSLLRIDPAQGLVLLDALNIEGKKIETSQHCIITQIYSRLVASDLKLILLEHYAPEHEAVIIEGAGLAGQEKVTRVPLWELDHSDYFDHLTSLYLAPAEERSSRVECKYPLDPLVKVMDKLLAPDGCPWDRKQNHQTLKPYLLEEAYEVLEAIDSGDMHKLREELGDLLLQVVFHTQLGQEKGYFDHNDVIGEITEKMIRRHPHVFADVQVKNSQEVLKNWEEIKKQEQGQQDLPLSLMDKLNKSLPALLLAEEVQKRARKAGFDWEDSQGPWDKLAEEFQELVQVSKENTAEVEAELGDLLFAAVNVARFANISPEAALLRTIKKFVSRFKFIEDKIRVKGLDWDDLDLMEMDRIWEEAKKAGL